MSVAAISFDTLKFVTRLEEAGVLRKQAQAEAEALQHGSEELATKHDIEGLRLTVKQDISEVKFELLKWIIGLAIGQMAVTIGLFFNIIMRLPH